VTTLRLFGLAVALLVAATADAASVVGSYSNMRLDDSNVRGFGVGMEWPLTGSLDLAAEATSQFGPVQGEDLNELAVLAGPRFAFRRRHRFVPFLHGKVGFVRSRRQVEIFGVAIGADGVCNETCPSETGLAAEAGGGVDLRLTARWGIRLAQFDYRITRLASDESDRMRISAGVVATWGR
jgi:hypothetical protein